MSDLQMKRSALQLTALCLCIWTALLLVGTVGAGPGLSVETGASEGVSEETPSPPEWSDFEAEPVQEQQTGLLVLASDDDPPLADAGLDQEVYVLQPVHLDAGGSTAPDGQIQLVEWSIERPDETEMTPECPTCQDTQFVPEQVGTYAVTVTVTATNGKSATDTFYVEVMDRTRPTASLSGPDSLAVGESGTFQVDAQPGSHSLQSLSWYTNGVFTEAEFLDAGDPPQQRYAFDAPGIYNLSVEVVDRTGFSGWDSHEVEVGTQYSHFDITITETNSPLSGDEPVEVTALVENRGTIADTQAIILEGPRGTSVDIARSVTLGPGGETEVSLSGDVCHEGSEGSVSVLSEDTQDSERIKGLEECSGEGLLIEELDAPAEAVEGETVTVEATVRNTANSEVTQPVTLRDIHGRYPSEGIEEVTLGAGSETTVELDWETEAGDAGDGELTVQTSDDSASTPFELLQPAYFEVSETETEIPGTSEGVLTIDATITNTGEAEETQAVDLTEGTGMHGTLDELSLQLDAGESSVIELEWEDAMEYPGDHELTVSTEDDSYTWIVTIPNLEGLECLEGGQHAVMFNTQTGGLGFGPYNWDGAMGGGEMQPMIPDFMCSEADATGYGWDDPKDDFNVYENIELQLYDNFAHLQDNSFNGHWFSNFTEVNRWNHLDGDLEVYEVESSKSELDTATEPSDVELNSITNTNDVEVDTTPNQDGDLQFNQQGIYMIRGGFQYGGPTAITEVNSLFFFEIDEWEGDLEVAVTDQNGHDLDGASVELSGGGTSYNGQTDDNGEITFTGLSESTYSIDVYYGGEHEGVSEIDVGPDEGNSVDVAMDDVMLTATVNVNVEDEDGSSMSGVSVWGDDDSASTDSSGSASLEVEPDDSHDIYGSSDHDLDRTTVTIPDEPDYSTIVRFTMSTPDPTYIRVTVRDDFGSVSGAWVRDWGPEFDSTTDWWGRYETEVTDYSGGESMTVLADHPDTGDTKLETITIHSGTTNYVSFNFDVGGCTPPMCPT